ncbi:DUF6318 family protein [Kocuria sp. CPCC 205292]|uniref:DUF6318 family protein n=1 Tax=Kocuria cellulosilytica TaxID=3071451 RepID=UPI0034D4FAEF
MVRSNPVGTAIGGAALAALLLAGCGTDDDGAAASPSSAAPSASTTAAAPGPAATPDAYVPASLDGPAQNVPKPVMPDLAREESREGAQAFLDYWSDAKWYAYQTGDTSYARAIISARCEVCMGELDEIENLYGSNAWAINGRETIEVLENQFLRAADGIYKPAVTAEYDGIHLVDAGEVIHEEPPKSDAVETFLVFLDFAEGEWIYITAAPLPGSAPE